MGYLEIDNAHLQLILTIESGSESATRDFVENLKERFEVWAEVGYVLFIYLLKYKSKDKLISFVRVINDIYHNKNNSLNEYSFSRAFLQYAICQNEEELLEVICNDGDINFEETFEGKTALHSALLYGTGSILKILLQKGASVSFVNEGCTPLGFIMKAKNWNLEFAKILIENGADINSPLSARGNYPLHITCLNEYFEGLECLVANGADLNVQNNDGDTALHICIRQFDIPSVKKLLISKAKVNVRNKLRETPLYIAILSCQIYIIQVLLKFGADLYDPEIKYAVKIAVNFVNDDVMYWLNCVCSRRLWASLKQKGFRFSCEDTTDVQLLHSATKKGLFDLLHHLLYLGADPNSTFESEPLIHAAISNSHLRIVNLLLNTFRCDVNTRDALNRTPVTLAISLGKYNLTKLLLTKGSKFDVDILCVAAEYPQYNIIKFLLELGADVNYKDKENRSPIFYVIKSIYYKRHYNRHIDFETVKIINLLLSHNACLDNLEDSDGTPLLCHIIRQGYIHVTRLLLNNCLPTEKEFEGKIIWTAVHTAVEYNNPDILNILIQKGADLERKCDGKTALEIGVENKTVQMVMILLKGGAKANEKTKKGVTLVHIATAKSCDSIVKGLLQFGADPDGKNLKGKTPLHFAAILVSGRMIKILLDYGADINAVCNDGLTPFMELKKNSCAHRIVAQNNAFAYINGNGIASPNSVWYAFVWHVYKLRYLGLPVHESHADLFQLKFSKEFPNRCAEELQKMKLIKVAPSMFLIHIVKQWKAPKYMSNELIKKYLKTTNFLEFLPIYGGVICYITRQAELRFKLINTGSNSLSFIFGLSENGLPELPDQIVWNISSLLENTDLKNLIHLADSLA